ncbi:hypothetical protein B2G71_06365 [Novosphingobium sp. PC22D]|uniref:carboxymuconolactone decarboxylase family protein n=1 Tax=Novosphingobium sp. PC22D TaxID=1962403 RepID=UPI000BEFB0AF|nr:hypothetical protein [Novosphingobium sp. PC22D]PEQ13920.1 hypothetical protein B2G71_06365 [Novosphingobium sp. PC22D]
MTRVHLAFTPDELPDTTSPEDRAGFEAFIETMQPAFGAPEIPKAAAGFAIIARAPKLASLIVGLNQHMAFELPWTSQRADLRELMIQTLNMHFQCDFNFQSHLAKAEQRYGLPVELQAAIPYWKVSNIFTEEQRLVIEFTLAAASGTVSDELFARVVDQFGEAGATEFTFGVAWWSFWAILVGAIGPQHDFGYRTDQAD